MYLGPFTYRLQIPLSSLSDILSPKVALTALSDFLSSSLHLRNLVLTLSSPQISFWSCMIWSCDLWITFVAPFIICCTHHLPSVLVISELILGILLTYSHSHCYYLWDCFVVYWFEDLFYIFSADYCCISSSLLETTQSKSSVSSTHNSSKSQMSTPSLKTSGWSPDSTWHF